MNNEPSDQLDRLAHGIIGAAIEVHRTLGPGFLESVYEEALCIEFAQRQIPFKRQHVINVAYKGHKVGESRLDLFVDDQIIVELKAVEALLPIYTAQLLSYLRATKCQLGLLMNFNLPVLKPGIKRIVLSTRKF